MVIYRIRKKVTVDYRRAENESVTLGTLLGQLHAADCIGIDGMKFRHASQELLGLYKNRVVTVFRKYDKRKGNIPTSKRWRRHIERARDREKSNDVITGRDNWYLATTLCSLYRAVRRWDRFSFIAADAEHFNA